MGSKAGRPFVRRTALLAIWLLVVLTGGWLVHVNEEWHRQTIAERFTARAGTATHFVESYVETLWGRQRQQAASLEGQITAGDFAQLVEGSGVQSGVVVDSEGIPVASYPQTPITLDEEAARTTHITTALDGADAVSGVLRSELTGEVVVHLAVPYDTPTGRRVFSAEYLLSELPFQSFAEREVSAYPDAIYLVDGSGETVASARAGLTGETRSDALVSQLRPAWASAGQRTLGVGEAERLAVTTSVQGTSWRLVFSAPTGVLYETKNPSNSWVPREVLLGLGLAGLLSIVLFERTMSQRRRLAEQQHALARGEDVFRRAFDGSFVGTTLAGIDGRLTRVNAVFADMLGRTIDELAGTPELELTHPDHREQTRLDLGETLSGDRDGFRRVTCYLHADGQEVWVDRSTSLIRDQAGDPSYFVASMVDITALRVAQRERRTHDDMLRAVIANSQSMIYVKDIEGRYLLSNKQFEVGASVTEAELLGCTDDDLWPSMAPMIRENDLRAQRGTFVVEEVFQAADGTQHFETVKFPVHDPDGAVYATCGISVDVTASRRAAAALIEARDAALAAASAKSTFLATMSHEIRTPMNAVIGMTGLLLGTSLDDQQRHFVETVRTSGDALLAIINDILDFSRLESGERIIDSHPFDLRSCVDESLSLVAGAATGLDLVADVDPRCPTAVRGDANRLRQVLINLVGNAVKFTETGEVLLSVALEEEVTTAGDDQVALVFRVRDTGIGIPADRMHRLFKSFSQVDASTTRVYGGSGLGLAISKKLVEAMGGQITVTSEVGVGSTFTFSLVLGRCRDGEIEQVTAGPDIDLAGRRALLVDDNETNRRVLRLQLEGWGISCIDISDGPAALKLLREGARFDLAILDMHMPQMGGGELAGRIRKLPAGADLPLMLLTSLGTRPEGPEADLFAAYHCKPVRAGVLRGMLGGLLKGQRPGRAVEAGPVPQGAGRTAAEPLRVLLAEDNAVNQEVGRLMLRNLGHAVDIVSNGRQAVDALREASYDVVLMDIHMPVMDGLDATRAIRTEIPAHRQPRILALTASVLTEDRRAGTAAGMDGYLLKPVRMEQLADALDQLAVHPGTTEDGAVLDETVLAPVDMGVLEAPVDVAVLDSLIDQMGGDHGETLRTMIDAYLEQGDGWIDDLVDGARGGDTAAVRSATHALSSSSLLLGAGKLATLLTECGRVAREGDPGLRQSAAAAAREYGRAAAVFRAVRDTDASPVPAGGLR